MGVDTPEPPLMVDGIGIMAACTAGQGETVREGRVDLSCATGVGEGLLDLCKVGAAGSRFEGKDVADARRRRAAADAVQGLAGADAVYAIITVDGGSGGRCWDIGD
jgi:hypothetical protein